MGALMRATRSEIEDLSADPLWWPDLLDQIREAGGPTQIIATHAWSYGAFIGWVRADSERSNEYDVALRDYAHLCVMQTIPLIDAATTDTVPVVKERVKTRQWFAGKVDRQRYGEHTKIEHSGSVGLIAMLAGLAASETPVIEHAPQPALSETADGEI